MKKKQVTILELATRLNLSPSTVSRALNGKHRISEETRSKVQALAIQLGYRPNVSARHLRENRTYTLGLLVPHLHTPWNQTLTEAFVEVSREHEHYLLLQIGENVQPLHFLLNAHLDGLLVVTNTQMDIFTMTALVRARQLPLVMTGPAPGHVSSVQPISDTASSMAQLAAKAARAALKLLFDELDAMEADRPAVAQTVMV